MYIIIKICTILYEKNNFSFLKLTFKKVSEVWLIKFFSKWGGVKYSSGYFIKNFLKKH
jgi:hypothetical protein